MQPVLQPPAAHAGARGDFLERAVTAVAEQEVRAPVRDVEIEMPVAVDIAGAHAVAPGRGIDACLLRHVLELPSAKVAIERVAVRDALALGGQLGGRDEIDVETAVAVVVEQRDAIAAGFQDVVLRGPTAEGSCRETRRLFERDGRRHRILA